MNKSKYFDLLNGSIDGFIWRIRTQLLSNGSFNHKGVIGIFNERGYKGTYKGKPFKYTVKLPEGMVRHHQFYNDNNPNDGIVYMTKEEHGRLHGFERSFMETGGWKEAW